MLSSSSARQIVSDIHQRIQAQTSVNLAQLPEYEEFGNHGQLERILRESTKGLEDQLSERVKQEYFGEGPLTKLLEDPEVTEILVNGPFHIAVERHGQLSQWTDSFLSEVTYRNFLVRLFREAEVQVTVAHPFGNGTWRGFRLHISSPPCSGSEHVVLCLRRTVNAYWTFERLCERGWASESAVNLLKEWIRQRKNVLVVGGTGSGKTSVLSAYLQCISSTTRVVIIEDTPELAAPNALSTNLLTRFDPQGLLPTIDQGELVRQSLRMRPDLLVMGEVRGGEAKDLLLSWSTGHNGSWATLHGDSVQQALLRLEMLIQLGAPQWNSSTVRRLIHASLDAVVVVSRLACGRRALTAIEKITSLEDTGFLTESILF